MKYIDQIEKDILDYVNEGNSFTSLENLEETLWVEDSVTGNASGSYTFSSYKAKGFVLSDSISVLEALDGFGYEEENEALMDYLNSSEEEREYLDEANYFNWEWYDVTTRCYFLNQAIWELFGEEDFSKVC